MSNHYLKIEHLRNYDNFLKSIKVELNLNGKGGNIHE